MRIFHSSGNPSQNKIVPLCFKYFIDVFVYADIFPNSKILIISTILAQNSRMSQLRWCIALKQNFFKYWENPLVSTWLTRSKIAIKIKFPSANLAETQQASTNTYFFKPWESPLVSTWLSRSEMAMKIKFPSAILAETQQTSSNANFKFNN